MNLLLFTFIILHALFPSVNASVSEYQEKIDWMKEGLTGVSRGEFNKTCEWMRECKRKRSGAPPLLVISMDGFASKYINPKSTPSIIKMGECGGRAEYMYPSFPAKTFPNHYTLATGLYPGSHGIVDNRFYTPDGRDYKPDFGTFYEGEPIWNTVVRNGKESKSMMWLGSLDKIHGVEATFHDKAYNPNVTFLRKIENVTSWLTSDDPPALSMLYLEEPDWDGHTYGPHSEKVKETVTRMDGHIQYILLRLNKAGVLGCTNIIVVSDHGMSTVKKIIKVDTIAPEYGKVKFHAKNNVLFYGNISMEPLKCKNGSDYRVYRSKEEVPLRYHYDHENIGFPFVLGNPGTMFVRNDSELAIMKKKNKLGNHGWDNMDTNMQTIFYAVGPSIRQNITLPPFLNLHLYNFFADLMEIPAVPNNGTKGVLDDLLVNSPKRENQFDIFNTKPCQNVLLENSGIQQQSSPLSNKTGFMLSKDLSVCSITTDRMYILYSKTLERIVGIESDKVLDSSVNLASFNFKSISLVERVLRKLEMKYNVRIQLGAKRGADGSTKAMILTGFWCEGDGWRKENDYCTIEKDTRTEAYVIPASAVENFNCLDDQTLLFDYRVTFDDIEKLTELSLLPKSMPLEPRRRISLFIPTETFM